MRSGNTISRFSYADDIEISLTNWAHQNAVLFDSEKSEVVQFPERKREDPVGIVVSGRMIEPAEHIRWLGVFLDSASHSNITCQRGVGKH